MAVNETLSSFCIIKIKELILSGELLPGDQIKGEYLKSNLGVGLSPIREALSSLTSSGLVEFIDNAGFKVTSLSSDKIHDTYQSYAKIETLLLQEAIANGDEIWESSIMSALYRLSKVEITGIKAPYHTWNTRNEHFHEALISGCSLNGLLQVRKHFLLIKDWYHNLAHHKLDNELIAVDHSEHSKLAELAIARQTDVACSMLYKHTMHNMGPLILRLKQCGYLADK